MRTRRQILQRMTALAGELAVTNETGDDGHMSELCEQAVECAKQMRDHVNAWGMGVSLDAELDE